MAEYYLQLIIHSRTYNSEYQNQIMLTSFNGSEDLNNIEHGEVI